MWCANKMARLSYICRSSHPSPGLTKGPDFHKECGAYRRLNPARVHRVRMPSRQITQLLAASPRVFPLDEHGVFCLRRDYLP